MSKTMADPSPVINPDETPDASGRTKVSSVPTTPPKNQISSPKSNTPPPKSAWQPSPGPQFEFVTCPVFEVFFGGARGGGKTDAELGGFGLDANDYGENAIGVMFRRTRTELKEAIERSRAIYGSVGAKFHEQDKVWRFPNKARLTFAYLEHDSDADRYQGHNYSHILIDELGNFPSPSPVMKLMATLRSGAGVPVKFRATGNPGGPGHQWVKARYITPDPRGYKRIISEFKDPFTGKTVSRDRMFIPSMLKDNSYLGSEYVANLYMSGSESLVKAWLTGDWSVVLGAYFSEWSSDRHVIEPFEIPAHWARVRALDWGSAKPFCVLWAAVADGDPAYPFPLGTLVVYREWYGWNGKPNEGCKLPPNEVANGILEREAPGEKIIYTVADPATRQSDSGPSIMERLAKGKIFCVPGDNKRIPGWTEVRQRLRGEERDGAPGIVFFNTCVHTIRTLPALQHDIKKPEDCDTAAEDHAPDTVRYLCMSRPYARRQERPQPPKFPDFGMTIGEIIDFAERIEKRQTKL